MENKTEDELETEAYTAWANSDGSMPFEEFYRQYRSEWLNAYETSTGRYSRMRNPGPGKANLSMGKPAARFSESVAVVPIHYNAPSGSGAPRMREALLNSPSLTWSAIDPSSAKGMALRGMSQTPAEKKAASLNSLTGASRMETLMEIANHERRVAERAAHSSAILGPARAEIANAASILTGLREASMSSSDFPGQPTTVSVTVPIPSFTQSMNPISGWRFIYMSTNDMYGNPVTFQVYPSLLAPVIRYIDPTRQMPSVISTMDTNNTLIFVPEYYISAFIPNIEYITKTPLPPAGATQVFTISGGGKKKRKTRSKKKRYTRRK